MTSINTPQVRRIVITGGPCAGKSKAIERLQPTYGNHATFMPEVARSLLQRGFPVRPPDGEWTETWQICFQAAVLQIQELQEERLTREAQLKGHTLLICDRGIMDGASYLRDGKTEFCRRFGVSEQEIIDRYHAVIHLESLACPSELQTLESYARDAQRTDSIEEARQFDQRIAEAWSGHPNYRLIKITRSMDEKIEILKRLIDSLV